MVLGVALSGAEPIFDYSILSTTRIVLFAVLSALKLVKLPVAGLVSIRDHRAELVPYQNLRRIFSFFLWKEIFWR